MDGYKDRQERESERADQLNHVLGHYIAVGINNPKKYPEKPLLSGAKKKPTQSPEQFRQLMKQRYGKK